VIDLHAHVLPGVDDGPPSPADALELLEAAAREGITTVAATSHVRAQAPSALPRELAPRTAALQEELHRVGIAVELVSGAEVDLAWAGAASDDDLRACTYGGRGTDLLVETPYQALSDGFEETLFGLSVRGFRILLAHPERNPTFQREPRRVAELVARGTLIQVTSLALTSTNRRSRSRRLAERMLAEGVAHVLATDAHRAGGDRPMAIAAGVQAAARITSQARATWMVAEAPAAILAGEPLPRPPAGSRHRRLGLRR
jgi:protein-tyrosine phosphatase